MDNRIRYFIPKIKGRFQAMIKKLWKHLPMEKFYLRLMGEYPGSVIVRQRLEGILGDIKPEYEGLNNETKKNIMDLANHTLKHEFNYLGSGWVKNDPICWNIDLTSGYQWPNVFFDDVRKHTGKNAEIKSPWELSRGHHLLWLGEGYQITNNEEYAGEVVSEIDDWIDKNPFLYGVNWYYSMEVAIRAVNWMYAVLLISSSKAASTDFLNRVYNSLYLHGVYIYNNLEKGYPWSNNHYFSNLVGLLYLGVFFEDKHYGKKWLRFAKKEFYNEIRKQFFKTGIHYEKSISYHRLMVELTAYPLAMLSRKGERVPSDISEKVQLMFNYVANYLKPNGNAPLLADNDNGRFLPFTFGDFRKHGYLLDFENLDNKIVFKGVKPFVKYEGACVKVLYPDANLAIMRQDDAYLLVNNSGYSRIVPEGQDLIGTHTHNDHLSFEFSLGNNDIIVDPGTFVYTSNIRERNCYRSTWKHNTIVVDEEEQNEIVANNAFIVKRNIHFEKLEMDDYSCSGTYATIRGRMRHTRNWNLGEHALVIKDMVEKNGADHTGCMYFHFAEGIEPCVKDNNIFIYSDTKIIIFSFEGDCIRSIDVMKDTISPSYGVLCDTFTARISFSLNDNCSIITRIKWHNNE